MQKIANENQISEFLLIDVNNEGQKNSFDNKLIELFPVSNKPLILFGGISECDQIKNFLIQDNISSIAIGNFLNYKEHMIQIYKKELGLSSIRKPFFNKDLN